MQCTEKLFSPQENLQSLVHAYETPSLHSIADPLKFKGMVKIEFCVVSNIGGPQLPVGFYRIKNIVPSQSYRIFKSLITISKNDNFWNFKTDILLHFYPVIFKLNLVVLEAN